MKAPVGWLIVAAAIALALGIGYRLGRAGHDASTTPAQAGSDEREILYWYDPMVPDQRFDGPGKSPFMDMMLVPRYADEVAAAGVRIDPGLRQNLGIRTVAVEAGSLATRIRAPGTLTWDLREEHRLGARVEAIVERLHVRTPFQPVRAGQPLATLLAPALAGALAEYRALAAGESAAAAGLREAARSRLRLLGLTEADLGGTDGAPRVLLRAPAAGVVSAIEVREGQSVMPGEPMFRLNGDATLWLELALPQAEAGAVGVGDAVELSVTAFPGERFAGEIQAMLPELDPRTRTRTARVELPNPGGRLAAGMYVEAELRSAAGLPRPLVPSEALIQDGRGARVIVAGEDGFLPVAVRIGRRADGLIEVLEGLDGGEQVVVSGQFLIDSEASLGGALQRMGAGHDPQADRTGDADPEGGHGDHHHRGGTPVQAGQDPAQDDPGMAAPHEAHARIEAIEPHRIVLDHGPFASLRMPAMVMGFRVDDPGLVEGLAVGDRVRVAVRREGRALVVERIERIGGRP